MAPDSSRIAGKLVLSTALVIAGLLAFAPTLLNSYVIGLMTRAFCFALLVISVDLLWGYTGILSLGQSAFFGIGAYGIGIAFTHVTGSWLGMALGFIGGILVAVVIAAALAWFTFYARISLIFPFYVSVVTLSVAVVFYQVVLSGGELTGSSQGLSGFKSVEISQLSWYWILLATLAMFGYLGHQLVTSDAGTVLVSIRENEERCRYLGYNTPQIKAMLFIACAVLAAVSGSFYAVYTTIVAPSLVGFTLGTDAVIWTALGGRGTIIGPVIGAILINVIGPALNARFPFLWQLFLGILFVTVVTLAPRGLLPMLSHLGLPRHRLAENPPIGDTITHHKEKQSAVGDVRPKLSSAEALRVVDVTKHFGSLDVLRGVNLGVMRGELLSIVGPNGAGKTDSDPMYRRRSRALDRRYFRGWSRYWFAGSR